MKTLKTLCLLLFAAATAMAQPSPDDLYISGYVLDQNGQAQANISVCVTVSPNIITFPSDTICTTSNANGWYALFIPNGSMSGPNIPFQVFMTDSCGVSTVTVDNEQGTVDNMTLDWVTCGSVTPSCDASFTASNDSTNGPNGLWTFTASATGTAPFTYDWWVDGTSYSTQTVTHNFSGGTVGVFLTVTDANGCESFTGDTLYLDGNLLCGVQIGYQSNPILGGVLTAYPGGTAPFTYLWNTGETTADIMPNAPGTYCVTITDAEGCSSTACYTVSGQTPCSVDITTTMDSVGGGILYTLTASAGFVDYVWSNNATGQTITLLNPSPNGEVICVTATDQSGCVATACDTLLPNSNNGPCEADFVYPGNPNGVLLVGDTVQFVYAGTMSPNNSYLWEFTVGNFSFTSTDQNPMISIPPTLIPINGMWVTICVTVTDAATGCTDTYCQDVFATPDTSGGCEAYFIWYESSILGNPLPAAQFVDTSMNAASWHWDFGDNSFSTEQNPLHVYSQSGTYYVCLTIVSADQSCQNTYCEYVTVGTPNGNCDASFSNSGPTPIGYTFSATVQDPNLYYIWELDNTFLGDGYEAYAPGLTNGVHTVCLTVIDSLNGCSDTECITFTVGSNNCYGYISGAVYAGSNNQPLDEGVVYLITFDPLTNQLTAVDSMVLDSGNYYFFGPLDCGDYMVKAAAYSGSQYYSGHIPTYYGNSPFWGFAQTITLGQVNTQVTADITLIAANNPGGPGFIGGDVTEGANKMDPGDPLSGMQVMIFDLAGNAITYGYTDGNGEFGFGDLAWGTYQVYVEVLGVQTIPAIVTIGPDNPSEENVHIFASESLISTGIAEFDFEGAISDVYPNPVVNQASITFNLDAEILINVSVVDLAGRTVSTETMSVAGGENTISVRADNLKSGYYFLNIQDVEGNFSVTRKFMRID